VRNFSSLIAPVTKVPKSKIFEWNNQTQKAVESIKEKLTSAPILALPTLPKYLRLSVKLLG